MNLNIHCWGKKSTYLHSEGRGEINARWFGAALDFGFAIHTEVGLTTIGAKVNNKLVPIGHELKNGDIVEILTTQKVSSRRIEWLESG